MEVNLLTFCAEMQRVLAAGVSRCQQLEAENLQLVIFFEFGVAACLWHIHDLCIAVILPRCYNCTFCKFLSLFLSAFDVFCQF